MSERTLGEIAMEAWKACPSLMSVKGSLDTVAAAVEAEVLRMHGLCDEGFTNRGAAPLAADSTPQERRRMAIHAGAVSIAIAMAKHATEVRSRDAVIMPAARDSEALMAEIERREIERRENKGEK